MKLAQAIEQWQQGARLLFGEYRSSKAETINYRDKETRQMTQLKMLRHVVEVGSDSVMVGERVPDNFNPAEYKSPFTRGQKVVVHIDSLLIEKGVPTCRGRVEQITG